MRAARFDGQTVKVMSEVHPPTPAPGEALVRVRRVGLTPADAKAAGRFAGTLGHELVGVVEKIDLPADAPANLRSRAGLKGKRVVASSSVLCGHCDMCRAGLSLHCRHRTAMGLAGRDGTLAEYVCVPLLNLHPLPDSLGDDQGVIVPQLADAVHLAHLVRADSRAFITVLGDNLAALLATLALATFNRSARLLASRRDRLELCDRWGLKHRAIDEAGRRQDQDVVIECTGTSAGLRLALQYVRPRGTVVLTSPAGGLPVSPNSPLAAAPDPDWATPVDLSMVVGNEVNIQGSREGTVPDGIAFLLEHPVDAPALISRRLPLEKCAEALQLAGDPGQLKVVVEL